MVAEVQRHLFTVEEFERMGEAGIFSENDRLELIDGEIREMAPIGPPHASIVDAIAELLFARLLGKVNVRVQNPVRVSAFTEPQPDLAVLRRRGDRYRERHPEADDILINIEVADATLLYNRLGKCPDKRRPEYPRCG